jgi:GGDEF domain-containing protein
VTRRKSRPSQAPERPVTGYDEVTGVWNPLGFAAAAGSLFMSCKRRAAPMALAVFQFRTVTNRPDADDSIEAAMVAMAGLMRNAFRDCDVVGRVDTSSLAVFLGDCTDDALAAVEGVRSLTDCSTADDGVVLVAGMARGKPGGTLEDLLQEALQRAAGIWEDTEASAADASHVAADPAGGGLRFSGVRVGRPKS